LSDETAQNILNVPLDAQIWARKHIWQADWDDYKVGSVESLQRLARLWLMRDEIANALKANDDLLARYAPPTDEMAYARQDNTNLLVELGRGDEICAPSVFGEALEKE